MDLRQPFRWNEIDVLLNVGCDRASVLLKRSELPLPNFPLQVRPEFQGAICVARRIHFNARVHFQNISSRRHGDYEVNLIGSGFNTFHGNSAAVWFDFMRTGYFVIERRIGGLFVVR